MVKQLRHGLTVHQLFALLLGVFSEEPDSKLLKICQSHPGCKCYCQIQGCP